MNTPRIPFLAVTIALFLAGGAVAQDVVINITGNGPAAKYVEQGATMQADVTVTVGQTVRWVNGGNMKHTATSEKKDAMDNRIFDTKDISQTAPNNFKDVPFTAEMYVAAGGMPGGQVELDYFCARHPTLMKSRIILKPADAPPDGEVELRVRKNIMDLTEAELTSLRTGVQAMKDRPADDPTSWSFQANMHGVPAGGPMHPLFRQCQHGTIHFLTWHRGYLHYFERILRKASGDDALTLPYWNWSTHRKVPPPYINAEGGMNALFHPRFLNNGGQLSLSVVTTDLDTALAQSGFGLFSTLLEGPHGTVHTETGGGNDMSFIARSARDPIFWLHHGNVDRNWDRWLRVPGHSNPTNPAFLNQTFTYVDENGVEVSRKVSEILTSSGLGYRYDDIPSSPGSEPEIAAAPAPEHAEHPEGAPAAGEHPESADHAEHATAPKGTLVASSQPVDVPETGATGVKLEFAPKTVELSFRAGGHEALESASHSVTDEPPSVLLQLVGVKAKEPTTFSYGVYVNLPAGEANAEQLREHYVGAINLFGIGEHGDDHPAPPQPFDLTRKLEALGITTTGADQTIRVTVRPLPPDPADDAAAAEAEARHRESAADAEVEFERFELRILPTAPEASSLERAAPPGPVVPKRVSLPLPPRLQPESALALDAEAADPQLELARMAAQRAELVRAMGRLDADIARTLETICGGTTDFQDVERYDGSLGVTKEFVRNHERSIGQLQWLSDLADRFDGPQDSPGNVNGQRWGSGGMISADLFITAGHCFDNTGEGGWDMPFRNNIVISPQEIAGLMKVNFNYQINAETGTRRTAESFPVLELLEYRESDHDFAIVRLGPNAEGVLPGTKYGILTVAADDLETPNAMLCLIQHPNGLPKKVEAGPLLANDGQQMTYATLDTLGGSSGSPILSLDGAIVGVHTNGGCTEVGGANRGVSIGAIRRASSLLPGGGEHAAAPQWQRSETLCVTVRRDQLSEEWSHFLTPVRE